MDNNNSKTDNRSDAAESSLYGADPRSEAASAYGNRQDKRENAGLSLEFYFRWPLAFSALALIVNIVIAAVSPQAAKVMLIFTVIFIAVSIKLYLYSRKGLYAGLISFANGFDSIQKRLVRDMDSAAAVCDVQGNLLWMNGAFEDILTSAGVSASNILALFPDITRDMLEFNKDDAVIVHSSFGDRCYSIELRWTYLADDEENVMLLPDEAGKQAVAVFVQDETETVEIRQRLEDTKVCEGLIYIDNYDEALETVEETRRSLFSALADRMITNYVADFNGVVRKLEKDRYFFITMRKDLDRMIEDRFSILESVKSLKVGNRLALTLSIGAGADDSSYQEGFDKARASIELALGRGGDQAVINTDGNIRYFGGKSEATGKNSKVKARAKAEAFRELLLTKDKLIIMGHKNTDVDSFGASMGFWRIASEFGKEAYIVTSSVDNSVSMLMSVFRNSGTYNDSMFIDENEALELMDKDTMLVVVDVNRAGYTQVPELVSRASSIAVVDHHRKTSDSIDNAVLSYIEPYASSASEMVTELIQYISENIDITGEEANALYAGMVIDTQNFVVQAGVKTFEAAAYLRRCGADVVRVRKMFRDSFDDCRARADAMEKAEIYREHFALSVCDPAGADSPQVVGAQAANGLLGIKGIKAAVVLTPFDNKIYISARSIDEVNVQVMLEKLGGGGHKSVAGAQLTGISVEEAKLKVMEAIDVMIEEGEVI